MLLGLHVVTSNLTAGAHYIEQEFVACASTCILATAGSASCTQLWQRSHSKSRYADVDRLHTVQLVKPMVRTENSPEDKEKEEQYEHNHQNQVWYNLWLHVLLIVWCIITGFKLYFSSRGHSGIQAAGLQACSTSSTVVLWMQKRASITSPRQTSRRAYKNLPSKLPPRTPHCQP